MTREQLVRRAEEHQRSPSVHHYARLTQAELEVFWTAVSYLKAGRSVSWIVAEFSRPRVWSETPYERFWRDQRQAGYPFPGGAR